MNKKHNLPKPEYIVSIYGHNHTPFSWNKNLCINDEKSMTNAIGMIVYDDDDNKYIIASRKKLAMYKNYIVFHRKHDNIMTNKLHAIFQLIDYDIIIFGTDNSMYFDETKSKIVLGNPNINNSITAYKFKKIHVIKQTKKYFSTKIDIVTDGDEVKYQFISYEMKYLDTVQNNNTYVPGMLAHKFKIQDNSSTSIQSADCSDSIILNETNEIIGFSLYDSDKILYVLPIQFLETGFKIFLKSLDQKNNDNFQKKFTSITDMFSITTHIDHEDDKYICNKQIQIVTENGIKIIKKGDQLLEVNDIKIKFLENEFGVDDPDVNKFVNLAVYIKLHPSILSPLKIKINRNQKNIIFNIHNIITIINKLQLSAMTYFLPSENIPIINYKGIIITTLSHELIDLLYSYYETIQNEFITNNINDNNNSEILDSHVVMIDCINDDYDDDTLPNLKSKKIIGLPFITKINDIQVKHIIDIEKYIANESEIKSIHFGINFGDQKKLIIKD
jgi:hypothetical protein